MCRCGLQHAFGMFAASPGSFLFEELVKSFSAAALFGMLQTRSVLACVCLVCGRRLGLG
jgi:hypothetical protein